MNNPYSVYVGSLDLAATHTVKQVIEFVDEDNKFERILKFVQQEMSPTDKAIIFCGKKVTADCLSCDFAMKYVRCQSIHGNRDQSDREQALADIKSGEVRILVATDVGKLKIAQSMLKNFQFMSEIHSQLLVALILKTSLMLSIMISLVTLKNTSIVSVELAEPDELEQH